MFPMPNATDPGGTRQFNNQFEGTVEKLRLDQVLRVDWNVAPNTTFYSRLQFGHEVCARGYVASGCPANLFLHQNLQQMQNSYDIDTFGIVNTLLHTFNPSTVLEVTAGLNHSAQVVYALDQSELDKVSRSLLPGVPSFFPQANPLNVIPNMNFGGSNALPGTRNLGGFEGRYPFDAKNPTWDFTANLTKLKGAHNMKAGIFVERVLRPARAILDLQRHLQFRVQRQQPVRHQFQLCERFARLDQHLHGIDRPAVCRRADSTRSSSSRRTTGGCRRSSRSTTACGSSTSGRPIVAGQEVAYFDPAQWDPAKAPKLYEPVCPNNAATCSGTVRQAQQSAHGSKS